MAAPPVFVTAAVDGKRCGRAPIGTGELRRQFSGTSPSGRSVIEMISIIPALARVALPKMLPRALTAVARSWARLNDDYGV